MNFNLVFVFYLFFYFVLSNCYGAAHNIRFALLSSIHEESACQLSKKLIKEADKENKAQNATPLKNRKRKHEDDPHSPGKRFKKVKDERQALESFLSYMESHIARSEESPSKITPLNHSTVLRSALRHITMGANEHFSCLRHLKLNSEKFPQTHFVLQSSIDFERTDKKGRTNLQRMLKGNAPVGPDGLSMNLHHLSQEDGLLAELTRSTHAKFYGTLHFKIKPGTSHINRSAFDAFRKKYWQQRAEDEMKDRQLKKPLLLASKV